MADNFTFPIGVNTYVPSLHGDLLIEFSRNPDKFAINRYTNIRKVPRQRDYYIRMKNDSQDRVVNQSDIVWADSNDRPQLTQGNDSHEFKPYNCIRRCLTRKIGHLATDQAAWDLIAQESRSCAMQAMTHRSLRVATTLTTSGNWGSNVGNASSLGGAVWGSATSTTPAISKSLIAAQIAIEQGTLGVVQASDLYLVFNPNTAKVVRESQEMIDMLKQSPFSLPLWMGQDQFRKYGLPEQLMGLNIVVDNTTYNSALPGNAVSRAFTFPDNVALLITKQQAVEPVAGAAFSTFELFAYEEFVTEVFNDPENRLYRLHVTENVDDSFIFSAESGYMINTNS